MAKSRPGVGFIEFRVIFWGGLSGSARRRRRKQAFEPLICHPGPRLNGPVGRRTFFTSGRGSA